MCKVNSENNGVREFKEGDILKVTWGFEPYQTGFLRVLRVMSKTVEVVTLGRRLEGDTVNGEMFPEENNVIGEPFRRKVRYDQYMENEPFIAIRKDRMKAYLYNLS